MDGTEAKVSKLCICIECGHSFLRPGSRGRCPSRCATCRRRHAAEGSRRRYASGVEVRCKRCDCSFTASSRTVKYCEACRSVLFSARLHVCTVCGVSFHKGGGNENGLFCSNKCAAAHRTEQARERRRQSGDGLRSLLAYVKRLMVQDAKWYREECASLADWMHEWDRPLRERRKAKRSRPTGSRKHRTKCRLRGLPYESGIGVEAVYSMDAGVCQLCGGEVVREYDASNPLSATIDHIVPLCYEHNRTHGHQLTNVQLAHMKCNSKKTNTLEHPSHLDALNPRAAAQRTRGDAGRRMFDGPPRVGRAGKLPFCP